MADGTHRTIDFEWPISATDLQVSEQWLGDWDYARIGRAITQRRRPLAPVRPRARGVENAAVALMEA